VVEGLEEEQRLELVGCEADVGRRRRERHGVPR
jgi:hypothetical protein